MALLFLDSFDHYATADLPAKWSSQVGSPTIQATSGRRGGGAVQVGASFSDLGLNLTPTGTTLVLGMAIRWPAVPSTPLICTIKNSSGTAQCALMTDGGGFIQARKGTAGGTILGTATTGALPIGTYAYLEVQIVVDPSAGSFLARVNGTTVLTLTAVNTANTGTAGWGQLHFCDQQHNTNILFDDLYVLDGSGAAPLTSPLGDSRVDVYYPNGAGSNTGWTPSAGANYACVNDVTPNGDTSYVNAPSSPLTDTYATQDVTTGSALIYGVQVNLDTRKTDSGTCTVAPAVRSGGTTYIGTTLAPNAGLTYSFLRQPYPTDPATGAAWLASGFNAAEFGAQRVS